MTTSAHSVAESTGWDEKAAQAWLERGTKENQYLLPWSLAVAIAANEPPAGDIVVLDVASGPGGFLKTALQALPEAKGIWFDNFKTMESKARENLLPFDGRVDYRIGDLTELGRSFDRGSISMVTCSRATHHLEGELLNQFYAQAFSVLRPGGWLANLDSVTSPEPWGSRLLSARRLLSAEARDRDPGHPRSYPHSLDDHLQAAASAGFVEGRSVWQLCQHVLVMARKPS